MCIRIFIYIYERIGGGEEVVFDAFEFVSMIEGGVRLNAV